MGLSAWNNLGPGTTVVDADPENRKDGARAPRPGSGGPVSGGPRGSDSGGVSRSGSSSIVDLSPRGRTEYDGASIEEMPDGSIEVSLEPALAMTEAGAADDANLAEKMAPADNAKLAQRIIEMVDADKASREDWIKRFKDGLEKAAIIGEGPAPVAEGGATVVHPLIAEAAVQFQARAMEEVFPSGGPVKGLVVGERTERLVAQAERVERHMNWQMIEEDEGYYEDTDKMLFILSLVGSEFRKTYWDEVAKHAISERVPAEFVIVPYGAKDLRTARRVTHEMWLDQDEMRELQDAGVYLSADKLELQKPTDVGVNEVEDDADGRSPSYDDEEDAQHHLYETALRWRLEGTDTWEEYLVTVSVDDVRTLAIRRNTVMVNGRPQRRQHFTHYKYLPGIGFYGFGLIHYLGGLSKAATDTLRASLDAAAAANFQGGFATKEVRGLGNEIRVKFGVWKQVDVSAEDLAKGFYTPPYREPSNAMVNLLELLVAAGQRFGSTTEAMVGEGAQSVPVGTTIARIEQATKVYSGIHRRIHRAAAHEFRLRAQINKEHLADQLQFVFQGSNLEIYPEDYDDRIDVIPVSDPNVVSTPQRIQVAEAVLGLARANPANFDLWEVERRYLQAIKTPDLDKIHIKPDELPMLDPVSEGARVMTGQAIKVFPEQDHAAHMAVHMAQLQMMQGSPVEQLAAPLLQSHIAQHMASQYRIQMSVALGVELPDPTGLKPGERSPLPPEVQDAVGLAAAQAAMAQQQQAQEAGPDPESALKMAQARKAEAEAAEVEARVQAGDQDARVMLEQAVAQMQQMAQALQENAARDQRGEQERLNMAATLADMERQMAELQQALEAAMQQAAAPAQDPEAEPVEIAKARIDAQARIAVAERQAAGKEQEARLTRMVEDLAKRIDELAKQAAERDEDDDEGEEGGSSKKATALPQINIGPIVIEKAGGPRTVSIVKNADGSYSGTSKDEPTE